MNVTNNGIRTNSSSMRTWSRSQTVFLILLTYLAVSASGQTPLLMSPWAGQPAVREGMEAFTRKDFSAAIQAFERLCQQHPGSPECDSIQLPYATAHYFSSNYADAIRVLENAPAGQRKSAEALHMLSNCYLYLGRVDSAVQSIAVLHEVSPASDHAKLLAARMLIRLERESLAEPILQELAASNPPLPGVHYSLGLLRLYASDFESAEQAFRAEIAVNPASADALYKLGDTLGRRQEWSRAVPYLQKSIWQNPDQSGPYILLGKAYLNLGDLTNAEAILRRAVHLDPRSESALFLLGQTLARSGKRDDSASVFTRLKEQQRSAGVPSPTIP